MKTIEFVLFCLAMIFYIRNIILDKDFKPSVIAFSIWLIADIANVITFLDFSNNWIPPMIMLGGAIIICVLSVVRLFQTKEKIETQMKIQDWFSILLSVISLGVFLITGNSKVANAMIQIVLLAGFIPIIGNKATNEPVLPWLFFSLGWTISLINVWNSSILLEWSYVIVQLVGCTIIFILSLVWWYVLGRRTIEFMKYFHLVK